MKNIMIEQLPSVSIVILNYNGKELLEDCFSSLQELDYPESLIEIILVDNGSFDDSIDYTKQYFPKIKIIQNQENSGFAEGCNIGVRSAEGKYIAFLNNDMRVSETWLKELIKPLINDETIGITSSKILNWDGTKIDYAGAALSFCGFGYKIGEEQDPNKYMQAEYCLFPSGGSMVISKDFFWKLGGFDSDYFAYFEDVDLGWRSWIYGFPVLFIPDSIVFHKKSQTQKKAQVRHLYLLEKNALCTIFKNYEFKYVIPLFLASIMLLLYRIKLDKKKSDWVSLRARKDALKYFIKNIIKFSLVRSNIQKNRNCRDKYIFPYFKKPFCSNTMGYIDDQTYIQKFNKVVKIFKIKKFFGPKL